MSVMENALLGGKYAARLLASDMSGFDRSDSAASPSNDEL